MSYQLLADSLDKFTYHLDHRDTPNFCNTALLEQFMGEKESDHERTNGERILEDVEQHIFSGAAKEILEGEKRCVLVLFLLHSLRIKTDQIYQFKRARIDDGFLKRNAQDDPAGLSQKIRDSGLKVSDQQMRQMPRRIRELLPFTLPYDSVDYLPKDVLLPFCILERVNDKGGTAAVFRALAPKELVSQELREQLGQLSANGEHGECYELAVKSFAESEQDVYEAEATAFEGLTGKPGIVRYFGRFVHEHIACEIDFKYHIMLEYAQADLVTYFYQEESPVLPAAIVDFWASMCNIAKAIETVHHIDNASESVVGWHGDIKPDNILLVHGQLKLADFGFATFQKRKAGDNPPEAVLEGGSDSYGSPEFHEARSSRSKISLSQATDIWSFDCVLSMAATWLILGTRGIETYQALRHEACRERELDAFHYDGRVLPETGHWHDYLRTVLRRSDIITARILDLIERQMLVKLPTDRLPSSKVRESMEFIVRDSFKSLESRRRVTMEQDQTGFKIHSSVQEVLLSMANRRPGLNSGQDLSHVKFDKALSDKEDAYRTSLIMTGVSTRNFSKLEKQKRRSATTAHMPKREPPSLGSEPSHAKMKQLELPVDDPEPRSRPGGPSRLSSGPSTRSHGSYVGNNLFNLQVAQVAHPVLSWDGSRPSSPEAGAGSVSSATIRTPVTARRHSQQHTGEALSKIPETDATHETQMSPGSSTHGTHSPPPPPEIPTTPDVPEIIEPEDTEPSVTHEIRSIPTTSSLSNEAFWDAVNSTNTTRRDESIIENMIQQNEDWYRLTDPQGRTPIMAAVRANNLRTVTLLLRDDRSDLEHQDHHGQTVLHHAVTSEAEKDPLVLHEIFMSIEKSETINDRLHILNMEDNRAQTALYLCIGMERVKIAKHLIDRGAQINSSGEHNLNRDVLLDAVLKDRPRMVKFLLTQPGVNFDWRDLTKDTEIRGSIIRALEDKYGPRPKQPVEKPKNRGSSFFRHGSKK